jgi:hypothetical protein
MPGDEEFVAFRDAFLQVAEINEDCHSTISYSRRCPTLVGRPEVENLVVAYYSFTFRHRLVGAPS